MTSLYPDGSIADRDAAATSTAAKAPSQYACVIIRLPGRTIGASGSFFSTHIDRGAPGRG